MEYFKFEDYCAVSAIPTGVNESLDLETKEVRAHWLYTIVKKSSWHIISDSICELQKAISNYSKAYDYEIDSGTHATMHDHVDVEVRLK